MDEKEKTISSDWKHDDICYHKQVSGDKLKSNILNYSTNKIPSIIQIFEHSISLKNH